ncbi:MAG: HRDC domain-containing protein, partial [Vallitaleaceae bacterium]|nr:HRDC domain-containing protein [Vallitaleaceae bacterium]
IQAKEEELLKRMTFYCFTNDCLRQYVLKYFGEKSEDFCGNCSNCEAIAEEKDISTDAMKILSCILRSEQRYGTSVIVQVLKGSKGERMKQGKLDQLSTYGIMAQESSKYIEDIINILLVKGYLDQSGGQYPVLKVGQKAKNLLKGEEKLTMKIKKKISIKEALRPRTKAEEGTDLNRPLNKQLFEELRDLRNQLSKKERVPAYIIFPDTTLKEMTRKLPKNMTEFERINGVGKVKLEKYGKKFLEVINRELYAGVEE